MGNTKALSEKLARHRSLWNLEEMDRPLITFRLLMEGMELYHGAATLPDGLLRPDQVDPEAFLPDYDRQWQMHEEMGHDGVYCATPFWKIPWIEAIIGCPIRISGDSIMGRALPGRLRRLQGRGPAPWPKHLDGQAGGVYRGSRRARRRALPRGANPFTGPLGYALGTARAERNTPGLLRPPGPADAALEPVHGYMGGGPPPP